MKRAVTCLMAVLMLAAAGFAAEPEPPVAGEPELLHVERYFPLDTGTTYVYKVSILRREVVFDMDDFWFDNKEDSYTERHYVYQTGEYKSPTDAAFVLQGADYGFEESSLVFTGNTYAGKLWPGDEQLEDDLFDGLKFLPDKLEGIGTEWDAGTLGQNDFVIRTTGQVASVEDLVLFDIEYADCLHVEITADLEYESSGWPFGDGSAALQGAIDLWFAPDIGLVRGTVKFNRIETDLDWLEVFNLIRDVDLYRVELIARVPAGPDAGPGQPVQ